MKGKMNRISALVIMVALVMGLSSNSKAQFTFSVNPGIGLTGANFGIKKKDFNVFLGVQYFGAKLSNEMVNGEYDPNLQEVVAVSQKNDFNGSIILPSLGLKYFLYSQNKVKAYAQGTLTKPLVKAKISYDGEEDKEFSDAVNGLKLFGGELGVGMEYFFDDNFSIGGEFGCRFLSMKLSYSYEEEIYNPRLQDTEIFKAKNEVNAKVNPVFTKICLNFYLSRKKS